jgi:hypothetical protein
VYTSASQAERVSLVLPVNPMLNEPLNLKRLGKASIIALLLPLLVFAAALMYLRLFGGFKDDTLSSAKDVFVGMIEWSFLPLAICNYYVLNAAEKKNWTLSHTIGKSLVTGAVFFLACVLILDLVMSAAMRGP